jgi:hypothetical protein
VRESDAGKGDLRLLLVGQNPNVKSGLRPNTRQDIWLVLQPSKYSRSNRMNLICLNPVCP